MQVRISGSKHNTLPYFSIAGMFCNRKLWIQSIKSYLMSRQRLDATENRYFVKIFNIRRHSLFCSGRALIGQCQFDHSTNGENETTFIDDTWNKVLYRRRTQQNFNVIPYKADLTRTYQCQVNVEWGQGGGAVLYLIKYDFKPPSIHDSRLMSKNDRNGSSRNPARDNIYNDTGLYVRARAMGPGTCWAAWSHFKYHSVKINPPVVAYTIHLKN